MGVRTDQNVVPQLKRPPSRRAQHRLLHDHAVVPNREWQAIFGRQYSPVQDPHARTDDDVA
jgi:hypothetical protein